MLYPDLNSNHIVTVTFAVLIATIIVCMLTLVVTLYFFKSLVRQIFINQLTLSHNLRGITRAIHHLARSFAPRNNFREPILSIDPTDQEGLPFSRQGSPPPYQLDIPEW